MNNQERDPQLISVFESKDIPAIKTFLQSSAELELEELTWAIHRASQIGSIELVELFASKGVSFEAIKVNKKSTVLHTAVKNQVPYRT